jgi:hypothetical protein
MAETIAAENIETENGNNIEVIEREELQLVDRIKTAAEYAVRESDRMDMASNISMRNMQELIGEDLRPYIIKPFLIWLTWLFLGSLYYGLVDAFSAAKGFYYAGSWWLNAYESL